MRSTKLFFFILIGVQFVCCQSPKTTIDTTKTEKKQSKFAAGKMVNGTYFLVLASENLALEPYQRQYGSINDLNITKLDESAVQKWVVRENLDYKTKKPNGTFSIYLFVDETNVISNKYNNPRLAKTNDNSKDNFVIEYIETEKAYLIKSMSSKGDCMGRKEGRFAKYVPNNSDAKSLWKFLKAG